MHNNKGFSLIEFLVVVALIGVLSIFFWTPRTTKWNTEASKAQSDIIGLLKYYQKKSMRDGVMYFFEFDYDTVQSHLTIEPGLCKQSEKIVRIVLCESYLLCIAATAKYWLEKISSRYHLVGQKMMSKDE